MEHLVDSLGYLLKSHGLAYLNVFDAVTAPTFGPLLEVSQPLTLRCANLHDERRLPPPAGRPTTDFNNFRQ